MNPNLGETTRLPSGVELPESVAPEPLTSAAGGGSNTTITAVSAPAGEPFGDLFRAIDAMTVADMRMFIHLFRRRYSIDPRPGAD